MSGIDEPILGEQSASPELSSTDPAVRQRIGALLHSERYAVLCTQGSGQPYGSMVAFAATEDLRTILFSTPVTTRKYRLLIECERVALVADNRSTGPADMTAIEAVTATGRAMRVENEEELSRWSSVLLDKHPYLGSFVRASSCALFRVDIVRYLHVVRFQEVKQWIPAAG